MLGLPRSTFWFLIGFVIASCSSDETVDALFYPVDSMLNNQVRRLTQSGASLSKAATLSREESSAEYVPADTTGWQKELEVFYEISAINKPVNKSSYTVENSRDVSGLQVRTFSASEKVPVRLLKVYYRENAFRPERIEAKVTEANTMFKGTRDLELIFAPDDDGVILTGYTITGGQKMFLGDSVQYGIKGSIKISGK